MIYLFVVIGSILNAYGLYVIGKAGWKWVPTTRKNIITGLICIIIGTGCYFIKYFTNSNTELVTYSDKTTSIKNNDTLLIRHVEMRGATSDFKSEDFINLKNTITYYYDTTNLKTCDINNRKLAMKYYEDSLFDSAAMIWSQVVNVCLDAQACFYAGTAYLFDDQIDLAINYLEHSIELDSNNSNPYNNLGLIMDKLGKYDSAISLYEKALNIVEEPSTYWNLGIIYLKSSDTTMAYSNIFNAYTLDSFNYSYSYLLGKIEYQCYNYENANYFLNKAHQNDSLKADALNLLGGIFLDEDLFDSAEYYLRKSISLAPDYYAPQVNLGFVYVKEKKWLEAESLFNQLPLDTISINGIIDYVNVLIELNKLDKAHRIIDTSFLIYGRDTNLILQKAKIYYLEGKYESILKLIKDFNLNKLINSRLFIAECYYHLYGFDSSLHYMKNEFKNNPEEILWSFNIGLLYFKNKNDFDNQLLSDTLGRYWGYFVIKADTGLIKTIDPNDDFKLLDLKKSAKLIKIN